MTPRAGRTAMMESRNIDWDVTDTLHAESVKNGSHGGAWDILYIPCFFQFGFGSKSYILCPVFGQWGRSYNIASNERCRSSKEESLVLTKQNDFQFHLSPPDGPLQSPFLDVSVC
mmetsp:Transcript_16786/g.27143  ORF Transcript_16786/g.27143 Transcript_16786/m.27143 type:complete len:115 (+) Transcript_16786:696-1040(+)